MENKQFINDWHTVFNFGKHKGKRLMDVPKDYIEWFIKNTKRCNIHEAMNRIKNRKGVTTLIKNHPIYDYIPNMVEETDSVLPIIERPKNIDASLYGTFVEYLIKHALGINKFDNVGDYLSLFGLAKLSSDLRYVGDILEADKRTKYIHKSYSKEKYNILDICNISFCDSIMMNSYDEHNGTELYKYVSKNIEYFETYILVLQNFPNIPKLDEKEQETCDKISVGCVKGTIDLIYKNNIIDVKCRRDDDIDYYRKQLFTYACLHYLRYGKKIENCRVCNFMTGKIFTMNVSNINMNIASNHIKCLGSYCADHLKLFD